MDVPSATYRLQFHSQFGFSDAAKLIPYLHDLGISHIYASPLLAAVPGSRHGYDMVDPRRLNPELGTEQHFERLVSELRRHGMGLLLDIVPNHMAASEMNPWWMDVLENGRASAYANFFDIDWSARAAKSPQVQRDRVLLPILGEFYDRMLTERRIVLKLDQAGFCFRVDSTRLPVSLDSYAAILDVALRNLGGVEGGSAVPPRLSEARTLLQGEGESRARATRLLHEVYCEDASARAAIDAALALFNGSKDEVSSLAALDGLLSQQHYRLAFWRTGKDEVNYRRFFGLNEFVALREEDHEVFESVHAFLFHLIAEKSVAGLRIDHIDGMRDPLEYLRRLQRAVESEPGASGGAKNLYTIVEKITSGDELLPAEWPTAGTTGYDFANAVNTLFVDAKGSRELETIYRDYTGIRSSFTDTWYVRKRQVMEELFEADIQSLASRLGKLAAFDRIGRDLAMRELTRCLKEITARLGVYRTYCRDFEPLRCDHRYIEEAIRIARERTPAASVSEACFDFLERILMLKAGAEFPRYADERLDFVERWQQFTGAVMAKGFEDTAFFVHHGLVSMNEVGANPFRRQIRFGVNAFHQYNRRTIGTHPLTLNATSTHDTKWSEDARARINVLSELPGEWKACFARWSELNRSKRTEIDRVMVPSANEEILLYQSMLGVWPFEPLEQVDLPGLVERIDTFMLKAMREAKTHSNWISPNEQHEGALRNFVAQLLDPAISADFLNDFSAFAQRIAVYGATNGYSQLLLKLTSPGVPDIYQGAELWRLSLTDPDNRRPVSFQRRVEFLREMEDMELHSTPQRFGNLLDQWNDGRLKLWLTRCVLNYRRSHRDVFERGAYIPVRVEGLQELSVCSFVREAGEQWVLVAVPRLASRVVEPVRFPIGEVWKDTFLRLPPRSPGKWQDLITRKHLETGTHAREKTLRVADLFQAVPFAILVPETY